MWQQTRCRAHQEFKYNNFEIIDNYNKRKIVPFGEFLPFENFLNNFGLKKITEGHGSFLRGKINKNVLVDNLNILPLICYEIIFTNLVQSSSQNSNLIVNQYNNIIQSILNF